jgi:hypothetical protein
MGSVSLMAGKLDPPEAEKRRVARPEAVTVVFGVALPLVLVFFLFGDQVASIAAGSLVWQGVTTVQGTYASSCSLLYIFCRVVASVSCFFLSFAEAQAPAIRHHSNMRMAGLTTGSSAGSSRRTSTRHRASAGTKSRSAGSRRRSRF